MKKLAIYIDSLDRGGAERVAINLADYLSRNNVLCTIITDRIMENEYDLPLNVNRINLDSHEHKYLNFVKNVLGLRNILKDLELDTLLLMDTPQCLLGIPASVGLGIRTVVSERNDPQHFPGKKIVALVSRFFMRFADDFVFQTNDAKNFYKKALNNRGTIIFNPLFVDSLPPVYTGRRSETIVTAGRLTEQKNQEILIDVFYEFHLKYPAYKLVVYGEGHLRDYLSHKIKVYQLDDSVLLPGNDPCLVEKMQKAAMFVLPSNYEGIPNVLLEAMSVGMPCISTDCPCGGPRSVIVNNDNGILIPVGDKKALYEAMVHLVEQPKFAEILGTNASKIRKSVNFERICQQWVNVLFGKSS